MEQTPPQEPNKSVQWLESMWQAFCAEFMSTQEASILNPEDKSQMVSEYDESNWALAATFYGMLREKSERPGQKLSTETQALIAEYEAEVLGKEASEQ